MVDPRAPGRYLVGIECDGRSYHSGATARDRDRLRQHVLEGLGWRIHRIWSTDWWLNPEAEIDKVLARLQQILESDETTDAEPTVAPDAGNQIHTSEDDAPARERDPQECVVDATTSQNAPKPKVYTPVSLAASDPLKFYESSASRSLAIQLQQVIDAEGPLPELVLFRRVARAWGLERTGSRIVERLQNLVSPIVGRTVDGDVTFYWPASITAANWTGFKLADQDETSRRHIADVAIEEVCNLVVYVLEVGGAAPRSEIAKSVCRLIGMARTTADAEARVSKSMDLLCTQGKLINLGASIRLAQA